MSIDDHKLVVAEARCQNHTLIIVEPGAAFAACPRRDVNRPSTTDGCHPQQRINVRVAWDSRPAAKQ